MPRPCKDNVCRRAPSPSGVHRPLRAGKGGVKMSKNWGVVSFVHRTATISIFLSVAKCGPICRAQTCAHSGIETSRSTKGFPRGWPKSSKKFRIVHHFETLRPYISQTVKIEAYQQHMEKKLYPSPIQLSHLYGLIAHGVLQGGPKI